MDFSDLKPGDLFTFRPPIGMPWSDRKLYRKASEWTYHCADKVLSIQAIGSPKMAITPESSDAVARVPSEDDNTYACTTSLRIALTSLYRPQPVRLPRLERGKGRPMPRG